MTFDGPFHMDPLNEANSCDPVSLSPSSPETYRRCSFSSSALSPLSPAFTPSKKSSSDSTPSSTTSFLDASPVSFTSSSSSSPSSDNIALRASLSLNRHLRTRLEDMQRKLDAATAEAHFQTERADEASRVGRMGELKRDEEGRTLRGELEWERKMRRECEEEGREREEKWEREKGRWEERLKSVQEEKAREGEKAIKWEETAKRLSGEVLKLSEKNTALTLQLAGFDPPPAPTSSLKSTVPVLDLDVHSSPHSKPAPPSPPSIKPERPHVPVSLLSASHAHSSLIRPYSPPLTPPPTRRPSVPGCVAAGEYVEPERLISTKGLCRTCHKRGEWCRSDPRCVARHAEAARKRERGEG